MFQANLPCSGLDILRTIRFPLLANLVMWDTRRRDSRGQTIIGYCLSDGEGIIFDGQDFTGSPLHADDSDETVRALLSFLTLRPGDTDREYFADYTAEQLAWCQSSHCAELGMYAVDDGEPIPSDEV